MDNSIVGYTLVAVCLFFLSYLPWRVDDFAIWLLTFLTLCVVAGMSIGVGWLILYLVT